MKIPRTPWILFGCIATMVCRGTAIDLENWAAIEEEARGQTVYWNAWGGDTLVNRYINWATAEVKKRYGVKARHVKLSDTAEAVSRVLAEKSAGRDKDGSVDVIWINGENFASLKENDLLFGPFTSHLPNFEFVDTETKPTLVDFTVPVNGLEAPWSMGRFVFLYDTTGLESPPRSAHALLEWAQANPGEMTYPQPPDFTGTTFLKQILLDLIADPDPLYTPLGGERFEAVTEPLWAYLDRLHPSLWRRGRAFPANGPAQTRLLANGELLISMSFSPDAATRGIETGQLPKTVRTFVFDKGSLANANFLAIPYNSRSKEGALVLINFLLSPEAQARKQDPRYLGSPTVLALGKMDPTDRGRFERLPQGEATLSEKELGGPLPEPHPSWVDRLETEWQRRYGIRRP